MSIKLKEKHFYDAREDYKPHFKVYMFIMPTSGAVCVARHSRYVTKMFLIKKEQSPSPLNRVALVN